MIRRIPALLIAIRFALGPVLFLDARDGQTSPCFVLGLLAALLSDVFDGIIARRLGVATPRLREADSWTDGWFCLCVAACIWMTQRQTVVNLAPFLLIWFVSDNLALAFDWMKFRRFASYHAYSAKLGGLLLTSAVFGLFTLWPESILSALSSCCCNSRPFRAFSHHADNATLEARYSHFSLRDPVTQHDD